MGGSGNSKAAIARALDAGFGLETDIRDSSGRIVISHDPPGLESDLPELDWLMSYADTSGTLGRIALNIKSDGLAHLIVDVSCKHNLDLSQVFAFDMSIPDSISFISSKVPMYTRTSEFESEPQFLDFANGVWVDNFTGSVPQVRLADKFMQAGKRAAIVSPELHGRDYHQTWKAIFESGIYLNPLLEICTDHPFEAATAFCIL